MTLEPPAIRPSRHSAPCHGPDNPIEDSDGLVLGTFCVMDSSPHEWTSRDLLVLATLAKAASTEIALKRAQARLRTTRRH